MKAKAKESLRLFIEEYENHKDRLKNASEQTMRTWIDRFLSIFDWNCQDINQVQQEKMVSKAEREKLRKIGSTHSKPDYTLKNGRVRMNFLDAKDLQDNLKESQEIAFQARSYGWSAGMECSIVTNIEELVFYGCTQEPKQDDYIDNERLYFKFDEYLANFDVIFDLLARDNVLNGTQSLTLAQKFLTKKVDKKDLDHSFAQLLSNFRLTLARDLYKANPEFIKDNIDRLNSIVQSITNKILFIRICEGRSLEEEGLLLSFLDSDFWDSFIEKAIKDYETGYDGPIFGDIDELKMLNFNNDTFEKFVQNMYEPSPYKFDVIPVELIAEMYERFLSVEISLQGDEVIEQDKEFYVKQQGAISSPKYMVDYLLNQTFNGLKEIENLDELFKLKILEPACGSGTFLLGILETLEKKAIELYNQGSINSKQEKLFIILEGNVFPTVELRRSLINNCIYAIDMDYPAVQVAKMSLALKLIENFSLPNYNNEFGFNSELLLKNIGQNIFHGNTLVGFDILEKFEEIGEEIDILGRIVPFDIKDEIEDVFGEARGELKGFDFVVGNPPYVETKRYIDGLPYCREYFKITYNLDDEKADMSIYFIEKCLDLLNEKGKLGFLCQRRFFKTHYGEKTRKYLSKNTAIESIVEFEAFDIFKDRTTYIAMMIINKLKAEKEEFSYLRIVENPLLLKHRLKHIGNSEFLKKDMSVLSQNTWNFTDNEDLQNLITSLSSKFTSLEELKQQGICNIHGGIQVLRNDVYYINDAKIDENAGTVSGVNRRKDKGAIKEVTVELDACRPIIANKNFYKFKSITPTYYAIVPYTLKETKPIGFQDLKEKYPMCAEYLSTQESYIREKNKEVYDGDNWHQFSRTTNLHLFTGRKILFPMTAKEIIAAYTDEPVYPDNANMWGLKFDEEDREFHLALTSLLNSKLFSVIAIYYSNPQANGYRKMNKQFVLPVPIPYDKIKSDTDTREKLEKFAIEINKLQIDLQEASTDGKKRTIRTLLGKNIKNLNSFVYELYELSTFEKLTIEESYNAYMTIKD
ncbi:N-6 DNA methylase [Bacillus aerius]|uniref:Eco57I restriction-modification methylase domain-containing protein n=1 Tax=Bacillus aerius TaxID=293388 RepID=UPI002816888F|nr:N-6 DNA methylase [Bacillus aerius]WMT29172.1 N-6 DNA methylase [Bacillus aerius]